MWTSDGIAVNVRRAAALVLCCLLAPLVQAAGSQASAGQVPTPQVAVQVSLDSYSLAGEWKFQFGDDLAWANPQYDDSAWSGRPVPGRWDWQPSTPAQLFGWYRLTLKFDLTDPGLRQDINQLGVRMGKVLSAYELYAGGQLLGGVGKLPPLSEINYDKERVFTLPASAIGADGTLVLALRVWAGAPSSLATWGAGPFEGIFSLGDYRTLLSTAVVSQIPTLLINVLFIGFGLYHLYLYRRNRQLDTFLWFGLMAINIGIYGLVLNQWKYVLDWSFLAFKKIEYGSIYLFPALAIQMAWSLLQLPVGRWLRAFQWFYLAAAVLVVVVPGSAIFHKTLLPWQLSTLPILAWVPWVVLREARAGNREARTMSIGLLIFIATCVNDLLIDLAWVQSSRIVPYGFVAVMLAMAVSLADRFTTMYSRLEQEVSQRTAQLSAANRQLARAVRQDPLTGVLNRRGFTEEADAEMHRMLRSGREFSLILADVDNFKRVNDRCGHAHGDEVLKRVAKVLSEQVREVDRVGRWGGEEFILLLPETELEGAGKLAEKLRAHIAGCVFEHNGQQHSITMTFGIASQRKGEGLDSCIARADTALYHGKARGRNKVMIGSYNGLTLVS